MYRMGIKWKVLHETVNTVFDVKLTKKIKFLGDGRDFFFNKKITKRTKNWSFISFSNQSRKKVTCCRC